MMIYLGEWVINSTREEPEESFGDLASQVYSVASASGIKDLVDPKPVEGTYYATAKLEEVAEPYLRDYDEETFWDELADRLAERDLLEQYGEEALNKMSAEERFKKRFGLAEHYEDEFITHGVARISIR